MSEETPNQEAPYKPKRNWAITLLALAVISCLIVLANQVIKTSNLEKRIEAVEGMFAK